MSINKVFYKLRHIPTGKFFMSSKGMRHSHLAPVGKVYNKKPSKSFVQYGVNDGNYPSTFVPFIQTDWEIVTFEVTETGTIPL